MLFFTRTTRRELRRYDAPPWIYICVWATLTPQPQYIIYFWQGRDSSTDEKGASALLAKELDDQLGDRPVQVRVVQGKEPAHFRAIFGGTMIVRAGGKASGFKNREESDSFDVDGTELYHIKGTNASNTYGVAVTESAASLNSGDCFVLLTPGKTQIWQGSGSNDAEKETASKIAEIIKVGDVATVSEGGEGEDFWTALGGKADYPQARPGEPEPADPRLFQCTNLTGAFAIEEIMNFAQEDLIDDDVMLLDCYTTVFLWVGSGANAQEKKDAIKSSQQFVTTSNDGRDADTPIMIIKAGRENALFTQHFLGWDAEMGEKVSRERLTCDVSESVIPPISLTELLAEQVCRSVQVAARRHEGQPEGGHGGRVGRRADGHHRVHRGPR